MTFRGGGDVWAPKCFFSFFMNGIKKGSEKSSIPRNPPSYWIISVRQTVLLNHQANLYLCLFAGLPQGRGAENYCLAWNVQQRDLWKRARTRASVRDCNRRLWKQSHYDNVLKQLQGVKNVATLDISHWHIFSMECERYTKMNYTKTYGSYFNPNKSNK